MKKLRLLLLAVLVLAMLAPFLLGFEIASRYRGLLAAFEDAGYQLVSHDYQRGFFQSEARSLLRLPIQQAQPGSGVEFEIRSRIQHGPYGPDGWLGKLALIDSSLYYQDQPLLASATQPEIITQIDFAGGGSSRIAMTAFAEPMTLENDLRFDFAGLKGDIDFNLGEGRLQIALDSQGFRLFAPGDGMLSVEHLELLSDTRRGLHDIMLGGGSLTAKTIRISDSNAGIELDFDNPGIAADTSASGDTLDFNARYYFDRLSTPQMQFGPAELDITLGAIAAEVVVHIQKNVREMQQKRLPPEQQGMAMMGLIVSALPALLEHNPTLAINRLEVVTPQGPARASLSVQAVDMPVTALSAPALLLPRLHAEAEMEIPEKLLRLLQRSFSQQQVQTMLEQAEDPAEIDAAQLQQQLEAQSQQQLDMLIRQGFLKRENQRLTATALLKAGLLSVNGKMIPLPGDVQPQQ